MDRALQCALSIVIPRSTEVPDFRGAIRSFVTKTAMIEASSSALAAFSWVTRFISCMVVLICSIPSWPYERGGDDPCDQMAQHDRNSDGCGQDCEKYREGGVEIRHGAAVPNSAARATWLVTSMNAATMMTVMIHT